MTIPIRRRELIITLGSAAAARPLMARAPQGGLPVIGFLDSGSPIAFAERATFFRRGLAEIGYVETQNVRIESRWAEGHYDRLPMLAAELVQQQVAVLAATGSPNSAQAAQAATDRIPIVFANGGDPVRDGLVASLNRPAGNLTGVSYYNSALVTKRVGILLELLPSARRVGFMVNPSNPNAKPDNEQAQTVGRTHRVEIFLLNALDESGLARVFAEAAQQNLEGIVVNNDVFFSMRIVELAKLAATYRIPTMYTLRDFVIAGGLLSYGTSVTDGYRRAGVYVGRILKGAKPAELPVELSSKFELIVNKKTATALGLNVPNTLLVAADEVIE